MSKATEKTKVIFRKFKDGDIIALFPQIAGNVLGYDCLSYMHTGQHGAASPGLVSTTKPATDLEYAVLEEELTQQIGYNLKICKRFTYKDFQKRRENPRPDMR